MDDNERAEQAAIKIEMIEIVHGLHYITSVYFIDPARNNASALAAG
jgi:hypothetical protein